MTDSSAMSWAVDGVSIQTLAWNISSWGGDRQAPPPLRGNNLSVPYAIGAKWYPKIPDSRTMTLNMWVEGANSDGTIPDFGDRRHLFEDNFAKLRQLFWNPYKQFNLTKQLRLPGTDTIIPVTARAQYQDGFAPTMFGTHMAQFSVSLFLADPFFYGDLINLPVSSPQTVLGDARTEDIFITLPARGSLVNQTNGVTVNNGATTAGLTLDVRNFKATTSGGNPGGGYVSHSGSPFWMELDPGPVQLGGANVSVTYRPRFF